MSNPVPKIGTVKVTVNNQDLGTVNVRQSNQVEKKVQSISYGQPLELGRAVDLDMSSADDGEAIVYKAETNTFEVGSISIIDGGSY